MTDEDERAQDGSDLREGGSDGDADIATELHVDTDTESEIETGIGIGIGIDTSGDASAGQGDATASATPHADTNAAPDADADADAAADTAIAREIARRSRRSFLVAGAATVGAALGYVAIERSPKVDGLSAPLRHTAELNARLSRALFRERGLARTFDPSLAVELRPKGRTGVDTKMDVASWRLKLAGMEAPEAFAEFTPDVNAWKYVTTRKPPRPSRRPAPGVEPGLLITLEQIRALPRHEHVTEFKCVDGWSDIVHWGGARFSDFLARYAPRQHGGSPRYIGMETADRHFYTGLDYDTALHPQTLLAYEMGGKPLTLAQGGPVRLVMPIKYGYKQLKQIAKITFSDERPRDLGGDLGWDWYGGI